MSHHPEESGIVPDDRLLVRPYVVPVSGPAPSTAPAWPQSGPPPVSFRVPEPFRDDAGRPGSGTGSGPGSGTDSGREGVQPAGARPQEGDGDGDGGGRRTPVAALALLALGMTGVLAYLLFAPDRPAPSRTGDSPALSLPAPVLPVPSPDGAEPAPAPSGPAAETGPSPTPSPTPSATASAAPSPPAAPASPKPPASSAPAGQQAPGTPTPGTLRMGDSGEAVRVLQERLFGQGFTYVSATGVFDSQTKRGVAQLQRDRGIKGDPPGVYGPATQAAFGSGG
ncbi:peptidoglycan-binding protein [Streptomyces sp. NPDC058646]|uniref:peptidoglycan-binding domain-containing protein n=1 Tax=Streptomyces sp. NPDC058646 TaxID=3346574 RepID=UPI00365EFC57